ncbi:hypothetical protein R5W23_005847 [Gemmata sp. JC673]|uniref:Uncharacterized protein n=1 Tax=Gemmata algarum TaxID=2975278 RepID=A0ABU5EW50_9BACT|nr:hypothetical protein [Gemmata algarum]MDY3558705.1 hypothetical protein [Gemmata algarum]
MSRFRAWVVAVALGGAAGAAAPVSAADSGPPADARPWYKKLFVSGPKPAGPTVRSGPVTPARAPGTATLAPDVVRAAVQAETDALLRRMEVCLKIRQTAFDKNDDELMRQADELERQAKAVYEARTAALGAPKAARAPLPTGSGAVLDLVPEKELDPKVAAAKLVAPAAPVPVTGTASAAPLVPDAPVREVKP